MMARKVVDYIRKSNPVSVDSEDDAVELVC